MESHYLADLSNGHPVPAFACFDQESNLVHVLAQSLIVGLNYAVAHQQVTFLDVRINLLFYLYFPPSSHLIYVCFFPVGLSLL